MYAFIIKRLLSAFVTLFAVMTLVFVLVRIVPGDPAQVVLGDQASQEAIEAMRVRLGLDRSMAEQYFDFIGGALTGDWGVSMVTGQPVIGEVLKVLPSTIELTVVSLLGLSFPAFVSAIMLLLEFSIQLRWFPVISSGTGGDFGERMRSLALPAVNLGLIMAAYITRVTRSAMLEVLGEDYVRTARAKGVPQGAVLWRHALRNALIPVVTVVGLYLGILIGNSVLTEVVFNRPGLGKLIVGALNQRDYTMLQGMMVIYTFVVVVVNLATDLTYGLIDPRVKYK